MPTGPTHQLIHYSEIDDQGNEIVHSDDCRCMLGYNHFDDGASPEALSVEDAADIWLSSGMDEDYTFGYDDPEMKRAADEA